MKKIMILIDCQNDFISGALGNPQCTPVVNHIVERISRTDEDTFGIITTYDTHLLEDCNKTQESKRLPIEHCIYRTKGWALDERIDEALFNKSTELLKPKMDYIFKDTFGSIEELKEAIYEMLFHKEAMSPYALKWRMQDVEIEIMGFDTDICVVSNALILKAHFPEAHIVVDAAGCWGTTKEKHNAALDVMESCQIDIINRKE